MLLHQKVPTAYKSAQSRQVVVSGGWGGGGALWSENSQLSLCQDCCLFTVLCYFPHVQLQLCVHLIPSDVRKHQQS